MNHMTAYTQNENSSTKYKNISVRRKKMNTTISPPHRLDFSVLTLCVTPKQFSSSSRNGIFIGWKLNGDKSLRRHLITEVDHRRAVSKGIRIIGLGYAIKCIVWAKGSKYRHV